MTTLLNTIIAGPVSAQVSGTLQTRGAIYPDSLIIQGNLTYGSGGTTIDVWVQTSIDGGTSWTDIANFHWTITGSRLMYTLSSATPVTTQYTPTDGTLTANTAKDGVLGNLYRAKYSTTGTYAANTNVRIDLMADGLTASP
jgi:hypothetical protein